MNTCNNFLNKTFDRNIFSGLRPSVHIATVPFNKKSSDMRHPVSYAYCLYIGMARYDLVSLLTASFTRSDVSSV